jgi:transcriptional regulator GlxA family with amidase domain
MSGNELTTLTGEKHGRSRLSSIHWWLDNTEGRLLMMDTRVAAAISLMRELLIGPLSIRTLSNRLNLSPARLRQLFKEETGESPIQYFKDLRLQRAEKLLLSTFLSVKEVSFKCGIRDVSHFVRDFKKRYGRTPTEYRVQVRRQQEINSPK